MARISRRETDSSSKLDRASGSTIDIGRGSGDRYYEDDDDDYYYERPPRPIRRRSSSFRNDRVSDRWDRYDHERRRDYDRRRDLDRERDRYADYYSSDEDIDIRVRRRPDEPYRRDHRHTPNTPRDYYDQDIPPRRQPAFMRDPPPEPDGPIVIRQKQPPSSSDDWRHTPAPLVRHTGGGAGGPPRSKGPPINIPPPPRPRSPVVIERKRLPSPAPVDHVPGLFQTLYDVGDPQDVTVHLELPIADNFDAELEDFSQLKRMGHFKAAKDYFKDHLETYLSHPYVFVQYAEMLLEMGDYNAFDKLNPEAVFGPDITPPERNGTEPRRGPPLTRRRRPRSGSWSSSSTISRSISPPPPPPPVMVRRRDRRTRPVGRDRVASPEVVETRIVERERERLPPPPQREREEIVIRRRSTDPRGSVIVHEERSPPPRLRRRAIDREPSMSPPRKVIYEEIRRDRVRSLSRSRSRSRSSSGSRGSVFDPDYDEMFLLRWNWRLLKAVTIIRRKGTIQEALDEATAALDDLDFGPKMGSTEIQIVALALKVFAHARLFLPSIFDREISGYAENWIDWPGVYRNLLAEGRIWDFRDIFNAAFSAFGSETACEEFFGTQNCRDQIIQDWVNDDYDESTVLAHLDILMYMILEVELTKDNLATMQASLGDAKALAERIQQLHPNAMKSRPFLRWIIAKTAESRCKEDNNLTDSFRELFEYLGNFAGLAFYRREWIKLPVYVPQAAEDPRWTIPDLPPEANIPVLMVLKVAKQLQDYPTQVMCYKLLILASQEPKKYFDELAHLQKVVQGDHESHLHNSLSRFLACKDTSERKLLLNEIKESKDWTKEGILRDPEIYWARDFVQRALERQIEGRNSTVPLRESPQAYFRYLPDHVQHFVRQNAGPGIIVPPPRPSRHRRRGSDDEWDSYGAPKRPGPPGPGPPPPAAPPRPNAIPSQNSWMSNGSASVPPPPRLGAIHRANSEDSALVPRQHQLPAPESSHVVNTNGTPVRRAPKAVGFKEVTPDAESQSATSYISDEESNPDNFKLRFPDGLKFNIDDKDMSDNATITLTIQDDQKPGEETVVNWKREGGFVSHSIQRRQRDKRNSTSIDGTSRTDDGSQVNSRRSSQAANMTRDLILYQGGYWDEWMRRHNDPEPVEYTDYNDNPYDELYSGEQGDYDAFHGLYDHEPVRAHDGGGEPPETRFTWAGDQPDVDDDGHQPEIPQPFAQPAGPSFPSHPPPPDFASHQAQLQRDREVLELERQKFQLEREKFEFEKQRKELQDLQQAAAEAQMKVREAAAKKAKEREEELLKREEEIAKLKRSAEELETRKSEKSAETERSRSARRPSQIRGKLFSERDDDDEREHPPPPPEPMDDDDGWGFWGTKKGKKRKGKVAAEEKRSRVEEIRLTQGPDSSDFPGVDGPSTRYDRTSSPTRAASKGPSKAAAGAVNEQNDEWYSWNSSSSRHRRKKSKALDATEADRLRERIIDTDGDLLSEPIASDTVKPKPKSVRTSVIVDTEPMRSRSDDTGRAEHVASKVPGINRHKVAKKPATSASYYFGGPEGIEAEPEVLDDEWDVPSKLKKASKRSTDSKPADGAIPAPITDKEEAVILGDFDTFKQSKKEKWHEVQEKVQETAAQNERIAKRPPIAKTSRDGASTPAEAAKPSETEKERGGQDIWVQRAEREQARQARRSSTGAETPTYSADPDSTGVWDQWEDVRKKPGKKGLTRRESYREPYIDTTGRPAVPPVIIHKHLEPKPGDRRLTRREKVEGSMRSQALDEDGRRHVRVRVEQPRLATDSDSAGELGDREAHGRISRSRSRSRRPLSEVKIPAPTSTPTQDQEETTSRKTAPKSKPGPSIVSDVDKVRELEEDLEEAEDEVDAELEAVNERLKREMMKERSSPKKATVTDPGPDELDSGNEEIPKGKGKGKAAVEGQKLDPQEPPEPGISRKPTVTDAESSDE